jgi:hypothetical protein
MNLRSHSLTNFVRTLFYRSKGSSPIALASDADIMASKIRFVEIDPNDDTLLIITNSQWDLPKWQY